MKIVFAGPSLANRLRSESSHRFEGVTIRAPAVQGDVMQVVLEGATVIGLIDGQFEYVAPVWHKELLYALHRGVVVFGASSMGALRAVECEAYGMRGIGKIFEDYASGRRIDDADVALLHGPKELGYPALTLPLVNLDATLSKVLNVGLLGGDLVERLGQAARLMHFKDRTWRRVADAAGLSWAELEAIILECWTNQKQIDALALLDAVRVTDDSRAALAGSDWTFHATPLWRKLYGNPET